MVPDTEARPEGGLFMQISAEFGQGSLMESAEAGPQSRLPSNEQRGSRRFVRRRMNHQRNQATLEAQQRRVRRGAMQSQRRTRVP
jgi:hypothetical protein